MIILRLLKLELAPSVEVLNTSWQVSTDSVFTPINVIAESIEDEDNLFSISFDKKLEPDIKYYARAMQTLSTGPTEYSEVEYFYADDINEVLLELDTPSTIDVPLVETNYDFNQHPSQCFFISSSVYAAIGNSELQAITYVVENSKNEVIQLDQFDLNRLDKYKLFKPLPIGEIFNIKLQHHGTNHDISQLGSLSIYTSFDPRVKFINPIYDFDMSGDLDLEIESILGMTKVEWRLLDGSGIPVWTLDGMEFVTIPLETFVIGECYVLGVRLTINGEIGDWEYRYFIADPNVNVPELTPPSNCYGHFPYGLGGCKLGPDPDDPDDPEDPGDDDDDECTYGYAREYGVTCYGLPSSTPPSTSCTYGYPREYGVTCYGTGE